MKIILLGYMASGKSTIGRLLAQKKQLSFIDLDAYISKKENASISEIFKTKGELYFRKKENEYLKELINSDENFILSLGGGTPCYANNMEVVLHSNCVSIYLKASITTLTKRVIAGKHKRPLVAHLADDAIPEFIGKHLFERQFFYYQAKHTISIDKKSKYTIVNEIAELTLNMQ